MSASIRISGVILTLVSLASLAAAELPPAVKPNSAIRPWVDQIGYRTADRKIIVLASDRALPSELNLELCRADTGEVVLDREDMAKRVKPFNNGQQDGWSKDFIAHLDLTSFQKPGRYFVKIRNNGSGERSFAFNIGDDVYRDAALASWKAMYFQRTDCDKPEKYAGVWAHGPAFLGPNQAKEARRYKYNGTPHYDPVGKEVADETRYDVRGGWWDAGDFNKYTGNTVRCHNDLLLAIQLLGDAAKKVDDLNIPESGNGVSDLLDEVRYATEYLIRLCDKDGAAFGKTHEKGGCPPDAIADPVQLTETTSPATISRAAALAYAALVFKELKADDAFADKCLAEAKRSWDLLQTRPHPWPPDPKKPGQAKYCGDWFSLNYGQMRAFYAACLFRLTKDEAFGKIFADEAKNWKPFEPAGECDTWPAIWVYVNTPGADAELSTKLKALFTPGADQIVSQSGFRHGYCAGVKGYWWGSNALVGRTGEHAIMAAEFSTDETKKKAYLEAAQEYVHYLFGRNAIGRCFLSNMKRFGAENSVMIMFHSWVGADGNAKSAKYIGEGPGKVGPFPGLVVGGVNGGMKRYTDELHWTKNPWEFNEPDITYQSPCATLLCYFALKGK